MNSVVLMGRLTRDPDIRWTQGPEQMCTARFTLAVDRNAKKEEGKASADFISCIAFGRRAEFFEKYVTKGMRMTVSGRIQTGSYTNRDGQKIYTTDVVINEAEFAESKAASGNGVGGAQAGFQGEASAVGDGFMSIPEGVEDEGLPFN